MATSSRQKQVYGAGQRRSCVVVWSSLRAAVACVLAVNRILTRQRSTTAMWNTSKKPMHRRQPSMESQLLPNLREYHCLSTVINTQYTAILIFTVPNSGRQNCKHIDQCMVSWVQQGCNIMDQDLSFIVPKRKHLRLTSLRRCQHPSQGSGQAYYVICIPNAHSLDVYWERIVQKPGFP